MNQPLLLAVGASVAGFIIVHVILDRQYRGRMRKLAAERSGESICQFARGLPCRHLDTAIIRHVYETLESEVSPPDCRVPIRITDHFTATFNIDPEDLEDLVVGLADHCKRSLDHYEQNPFYTRLHTVGDLVHFLCAQPKAL